MDVLYLVWSNFEIANLDLWRGEAYSKFFEFLDSKGGFYYEVRGVSYHNNVHADIWSIALGRCSSPQYRGCSFRQKRSDCALSSFFLRFSTSCRSQHFFNDIGYRHEPFQHCPQGESHKKGKCWCDKTQNFGMSIRGLLLNITLNFTALQTTSGTLA